ncbi:MAG: OsmC family protein [Acidobacteria bacterium]|nr:OsmC family protein [Acidobacteriota bacterium]
MSSKPPPLLEIDLEWEGDLRFRGRSGDAEILMDSPPKAGPSPVQALGFALAGCMAMDVASILQRGRLDLKALRARLEGRRQESHPKRLLAVDLRLTVVGDVPPDRVERAIQLSRETYCSVWHSLNPDIEFKTSFEIQS